MRPRAHHEMPIPRPQMQKRNERERNEPDGDGRRHRGAEKALARQAVCAMNQPVVEKAVHEHAADRYPQQPPRRADRGQKRAHHPHADQAARRAPAPRNIRRRSSQAKQARGTPAESARHNSTARTRAPRAAAAARTPSSRCAARDRPRSRRAHAPPISSPMLARPATRSRRQKKRFAPRPPTASASGPSEPSRIVSVTPIAIYDSCAMASGAAGRIDRMAGQQRRRLMRARGAREWRLHGGNERTFRVKRRAETRTKDD